VIFFSKLKNYSVNSTIIVLFLGISCQILISENWKIISIKNFFKKNPALEVGMQVGGEVLHLPSKNCKLKLLALLLACVSKQSISC
jgi:hypothetical protein